MTLALRPKVGGGTRILLPLSAGLVFAFLLLPIASIVPLSFNSGEFLTYPLSGYSLRWYETLFTEPRWLLALRNSFVIGLAAAAIAAVLGTCAAIGLAIADFPGKRLATGVMLAPLIVPVVIYAVGYAFVVSPLAMNATFTSIIVAHAVLGAPFVVVTVGASLSNFDWNLMRAAASLGAGPLTATRLVLIPLVAPGVVFGTLLAFAASLEEVVIVLVIAGPAQRTLPKEMFTQLRENISPTLAAAAAVLVVASVVLPVAVALLRRRRAGRAAQAA